MPAVTVEDYRAADAALLSDLSFYCEKLVHIQDKSGRISRFQWNAAQRQLHAALEKQLDSAGWVRAIVLKARKVGISTYIGARYYHKTTTQLGRRTYIQTHRDDATDTLFKMVKLMHDRMAHDYRHRLARANAGELEFGGLDGGYRVATAGNTKGTGRSMTISYFHGSEVAFWPHAETHFAGALQTVAKVPGTEIILESTANGIGGVFYDQWSLAERKQSDFIPVFLPWFIDPDNRQPLPRDYEPSIEEEEYGRLYGLDPEQICWMHFKNIELLGEPGRIGAMFHQENPATAAEAFQTTGQTSFIAPEHINRARRWTAPEQAREIPRVLGVDCARGGKDSICIIDRKGRKLGGLVYERHKGGHLLIANRVAELLMRYADIRQVFVDATEGTGAAVVELLNARGFEGRIVGVNFGAGASNPNKYANKRAEMWARYREWLRDPAGADIPDDDVLHKETASPCFGGPMGCRHDANGRLLIEAKEKIIERLKFSPDGADAACLTFAELLPIDMPDDTPKWLQEYYEDEAAAGDDWMAN